MGDDRPSFCAIFPKTMGYNGNDRPIPPALLFYTQIPMRLNLVPWFNLFRPPSGRSEGVYTFKPGDRVTLQAKSYDYVIQKSLASGGLGETYIAHHVRDNNQKVVIKIPNDQFWKVFKQDSINRFLEEGATMAQCKSLGNPHLVRFITHGLSQQQTPVIVMEYIPGQDLSHRSPLPEAQALHYIRHVGSALMGLHGINMIHRDVKPQNIILREDSDQAVLVDFGIVRSFTTQAALTHAGTRGFMDPWLAPDGRFDVYSLAVTLHWLIRGRLPQDPLGENPAPISQTTQSAIRKAMEEPEQRFATIADFLAALPPDSPDFPNAPDPGGVPGVILNSEPSPDPELTQSVTSNSTISSTPSPSQLRLVAFLKREHLTFANEQPRQPSHSRKFGGMGLWPVQSEMHPLRIWGLSVITLGAIIGVIVLYQQMQYRSFRCEIPLCEGLRLRYPASWMAQPQIPQDLFDQRVLDLSPPIPGSILKVEVTDRPEGWSAVSKEEVFQPLGDWLILEDKSYTLDDQPGYWIVYEEPSTSLKRLVVIVPKDTGLYQFTYEAPLDQFDQFYPQVVRILTTVHL